MGFLDRFNNSIRDKRIEHITNKIGKNIFLYKINRENIEVTLSTVSYFTAEIFEIMSNISLKEAGRLKLYNNISSYFVFSSSKEILSKTESNITFNEFAIDLREKVDKDFLIHHQKASPDIKSEISNEAMHFIKYLVSEYNEDEVGQVRLETAEFIFHFLSSLSEVNIDLRIISKNLNAINKKIIEAIETRYS